MCNFSSGHDIKKRFLIYVFFMVSGIVLLDSVDYYYLT